MTVIITGARDDVSRANSVENRKVMVSDSVYIPHTPRPRASMPWYGRASTRIQHVGAPCSKRGVGAWTPVEGQGWRLPPLSVMCPREEETAWGWLHRATTTSLSPQWKDNVPAPFTLPSLFVNGRTTCPLLLTSRLYSSVEGPILAIPHTHLGPILAFFSDSQHSLGAAPFTLPSLFVTPILYQFWLSFPMLTLGASLNVGLNTLSLWFFSSQPSRTNFGFLVQC